MTQSNLPARRAALAALLLPVAVLVWAYWSTLAEVAQRWSSDDAYSHGWLVPVFAVALLYLRRQQAPAWPWTPSWWGALLLAGGIGLRGYGAYFGYVWLDQISIIPCLAGLCLMVGGLALWRWAWPGILFLAFMIPLPYRLSVRLAGPMQEFATLVSTFLLQTLGLPAIAEGQTRILLSESSMDIVEACSGLRMLVVFFALSTAVALVIRRPAWEKLAIVASAVPIALAVNILRITSTGVLHETTSPEIADAIFHDFAGWLMMPVALGFLWVEMKTLSALLIEPETMAVPSPITPLRRRRAEPLPKR
jgi:exosortase